MTDPALVTTRIYIDLRNRTLLLLNAITIPAGDMAVLSSIINAYASFISHA